MFLLEPIFVFLPPFRGFRAQFKETKLLLFLLSVAVGVGHLLPPKGNELKVSVMI